MKKTIAVLSVLLCAALLFGGCSGSYNYDLGKYVSVGQYKGIDLTVASTDVTDEEIDEQIDDTVKSYAELVEVNRAAKMGDVVNIDYTGYLDGETFTGGADTGHDLELGSGEFIEGFEEQLVGVKPGEEVEIDVTFPDPYPNNADLAGKDVVFKVLVNYINEYDLPVLDDAFIKENMNYNSLDEYREAVRSAMKTSKENNIESQKVSDAWTAVVESSEIISYPQKELDVYIKEYRDYYEMFATTYYSGTSFEDFREQQMQMTSDEFEESAKVYAENMVLEDMVMYSIARAENITLTDSEYKDGVTQYAAYYGVTEAEFEKQYSRDVVTRTLLYGKVQKFIVDNANFVSE